MMRYLFRENILRANASTAGSIPLGFIIMVAIGCLLAVQQSAGSRQYTKIAFAILVAGLIATVSRGPWVGTLALVVVYIAISPGGFGNLVKTAAIGSVAVACLLLTTFGSKLVDFLPFVGSVDEGSVTYRRLLWDHSLTVIERNPWFGSRDFLLTPEMKEMLQGQHIIDVVNTYLDIALQYGLVSLGIFLAFVATILAGVVRLRKSGVIRKMGLDPYTRGLIAIMLAMLVTIGTVSFIDYIPYAFWCFAGLCVALIRIARQAPVEDARDARAFRVPARVNA